MTFATIKRTIVVIDDDHDIQDIITAFFKTKGFSILCFSNAEAALQEARTSGQKWDVVLTDLSLPTMTGLEFIDQIRKLFPNLPIILITNSKSVDAAVEAIQKGANDFIVKPIHFAQLQISIERALYISTLNGDLTELRTLVKSTRSNHGSVIGVSPSFLKALDIAKRVAKSTANILITGESGTGKEILAKYIHSSSHQQKGPLVAINCSAIPENLLESELFGHAKGSFTGANEKKVGLFEEAQDGTLFLDEIGDLSLQLQAKLLRVLQEKKIKRVGENQYRNINCRIISATHKNLPTEVNDNRFREDLFFRLNVIQIDIPALRERKEDILPLAESFLRRFSLENASPVNSFSKESVGFLLENTWRGNVRELENAVERAVVLCTASEISLENLTHSTSILKSRKESFQPTEAENAFYMTFKDHLPSVDDLVFEYIKFAVKRNSGARDKTAKEIGIDRKTLYKRMGTSQFTD